jgi:tripartite motif-containing protein 71
MLRFNLILLMGTIAIGIPASHADDPPPYLSMWGQQGTGSGEFDFPNGVAVDNATGDVYVTEFWNNRVQKFTANGGFVLQWGGLPLGSGDGEFSRPEGVAVDGDGNVYVVESSNHRVQKFTSSGSFIQKWGSEGSFPGQFEYPMGIAVDENYVYITDHQNHRVQQFTHNGGIVQIFGTSGLGALWYPLGVAARGGFVYVTDSEGWVRAYLGDGSGTFLTRWGPFGLYTLQGISVDADGNVDVAHEGSDQIVKYTPFGAPLTQWGEPGSAPGQFCQPYGVVAVGSDLVYVTERCGYRVQKFGFVPVAVEGRSWGVVKSLYRGGAK